MGIGFNDGDSIRNVRSDSVPRYTFQDFGKWCCGLDTILPFLGQTLFQAPPPWIQNYFIQQWYPGSSSLSGMLSGQQLGVGDSIHISDGSRVKKEEPPKTEEEKIEAEKQKIQKKREKDEAIKKYSQTRTVLNNYLAELNKNLGELADGEEKNKLQTKIDELQAKLNIYKEISSSTKLTTEKIIENQAKLQESYKAYENDIKSHELNEAKKNITSSNNGAYKDKVTTLQANVVTFKDKTFGILTTDSNGLCEWDKEVDILELLSTWNSDESTKNSHIMNEIIPKYKEAIGDQKSHYEKLISEFQKKLLGLAEDIDASKLSGDTKKALSEATEQLKKFDDMDKRASDAQNYSHSFDNLYRAIRLAKTEIADKELKEKFDFLGAENPYKNSQFLTDVKADLKSEGCENAYEVTAPVSPTIPADAKTVKIDEQEYKVSGSGADAVIYKADGTQLTSEEKTALGTIEFDGANNYKITKNGETTCFSAQHTEIESAKFGKVETTTSTAPADGTVENAIGKNYNDYEKMPSSFVKEGYANIILGSNVKYRKLNKENVIGFIDKFESNKGNQKNIIQFLSSDSTFSMNVNRDVCNRVVKIAMRQALACGLNETNCEEYKKLYDYFGVKGTPKYEADGYTPAEQEQGDETRYRFTNFDCNGDAVLYTSTEAKEIDTMLYALVDRIKKLNKTVEAGS